MSLKKRSKERIINETFLIDDINLTAIYILQLNSSEKPLWDCVDLENATTSETKKCNRDVESILSDTKKDDQNDKDKERAYRHEEVKPTFSGIPNLFRREEDPNYKEEMYKGKKSERKLLKFNVKIANVKIEKVFEKKFFEKNFIQCFKFSCKIFRIPYSVF